MAVARGASSWAPIARSLYLVAMAIFLVTIAIGILNGLNLVEFDRNQLLTHVHSGTIGWLSLSIVATTFVYFRSADPRLAAALAIFVPVYVAAFYTGNFALRAVTGVLLFVVIGWLVIWVWRAYLASSRSLPGLGLAMALSMFALGAVVGVLLQVGFAAGAAIVPGDGIGAHAGAMTFGYLVLAAMAVQEWRVKRTTGMPRGGVVQFAALFAGGLVIVFALLANSSQIGGMLYLLAELIAVVLFAIRILPVSLRTSWTAASAERHLAAASIWIVVSLAIFMYLVSQFIAANGDQAAIETGILVASDHATYIGVITNTTFAILTTLLAGAAGNALARQLTFWGMNLGLLVFVVGLVAENEMLKAIGAPVMGLSLLLGLAVFAMGVIATRLDPPPTALEADPAGG
jgi:hypothetical protein